MVIKENQYCGTDALNTQRRTNALFSPVGERKMDIFEAINPLLINLMQEREILRDRIMTPTSIPNSRKKNIYTMLNG